MLAESPKPSTLKSEIVNEKDRPPNLLGESLVPELIEEEVWIYRLGGEEVLCLREGKLITTRSGVKKISPKQGFWNKAVFAWNLRVQTKEGRKVVLASYRGGENVTEFFKNVFILPALGGVTRLSLPGPEVLSLLALTDDNPVFIPVLGRKDGGVLVTTAKTLKVLQNKLRIEGFLKA